MVRTSFSTTCSPQSAHFLKPAIASSRCREQIRAVGASQARPAGTARAHATFSAELPRLSLPSELNPHECLGTGQGQSGQLRYRQNACCRQLWALLTVRIFNVPKLHRAAINGSVLKDTVVEFVLWASLEVIAAGIVSVQFREKSLLIQWFRDRWAFGRQSRRS